MKIRILTFLLIFTIVGIQQSCRKDDTNLDVELSQYNPDGFVKGELDEWIARTLTDTYNIEVTYRFNRNLGDVSRNIAPPEIDKVKPTAEMVLNGFLKVYENVAGAAFIKRTTPKHFVFFGSTSYNTNGTEILGTASQGRRITLYNLNTLDHSNYENVKRRLRTIHHEYTHILNQLVVIPPSFELVTPGDYTSDWASSSETEAKAKELGFISRYARDQFSEDFAETAAHLLAEGQDFYDAYVASAPVAAQEKLRRKEAIVVDYFKQAFNIDFRELQREMALAMFTHYNAPAPIDPESALFYLKNGRIANISVDLVNGTHYTQFGKSAAFQAVWDDVKAKMLATSRELNNLLTFRFSNNGNMMVVESGYISGGTSYAVLYDFPVTYLPNGHVKFTYVEKAQTGGYNNGISRKAQYQLLLDFLQAHEFVPDWLPTNAGPENFRKFAGFYVSGNNDSYFYGPVVIN